MGWVWCGFGGWSLPVSCCDLNSVPGLCRMVAGRLQVVTFLGYLTGVSAGLAQRFFSYLFHYGGEVISKTILN